MNCTKQSPGTVSNSSSEFTRIHCRRLNLNRHPEIEDKSEGEIVGSDLSVD